MGVSMSDSSGGGRRNVDAELNLIPFIDLLSVCILFLLMTAVWVQISKMSAFTQPGGENVVRHSDVSTLNQERESRDWDVLLQSGYVEIRQNRRSLGRFEYETIKESIREQKDRLGSGAETAKISLRAADDVLYEQVILVLDALFDSKLQNVTIGGL